MTLSPRYLSIESVSRLSIYNYGRWVDKDPSHEFLGTLLMVLVKVTFVFLR